MNTRKRLRLETPLRDTTETATTATASTMATLSETLQAVIEEVRLLRVEQSRRDTEHAATIRRQEEELRLLRGIVSNQLSPSRNRASGDMREWDANGEGARVAHGRDAVASDTRETDIRPTGGSAIACGACVDDARSTEGDAIAGSRDACAGVAAAGTCVGLGYKLKPDVFDGSIPIQEYLSQFDLIARANEWNDATKTVALASSLRGKARAVLETVQNVQCLNFAELKTKLELRFGEGRLTQNYYSALTNRRQKFGEDLAALGSDIERLSRLAYPECPHEVRDKIACAQFVTAVADHFIRRTLQMEGITSLFQAVERAKALKIIQGEGFVRERNFKNSAKEVQSGEANYVKGESVRGKEEKAKGECWTCGKTGHFRSECPERGESRVE